MDSDSRTVALTILGLLLTSACILVAMVEIGRESGRMETKQEAVDAGAAEWTVDAKGVKGFRWRVAE